MRANTPKNKLAKKAFATLLFFALAIIIHGIIHNMTYIITNVSNTIFHSLCEFTPVVNIEILAV